MYQYGSVMRQQIAEETISILKQGGYRYGNKNLNFKDSLDYAVKNSVLYKPNMEQEIKNKLEDKLKEAPTFNTVIEVKNETTLHAAQRLLKEGFRDIVCLNFASARNPGGGFLKGSQAQEESLARASGLYPCIAQMEEMYNYHRENKNALYTDYMIFSPNVPVFRNDKDQLIDTPYLVSFITSAAVNAGVIKENTPYLASKIDSVMLKRIEKILSLAIIHNQDTLVLGAFGCGVFKNNPENVAGYFKKLLDDSRFKNRFKKVVFAILDPRENEELVNVFRRKFGVR